MDTKRGYAPDPDALLHAEIVEEKASALGRISRKLEGYLCELAALRERFLAGADCAAEYEEVRRQAELYFWYLTVQREVLGFTDHEALARAYPVPGPLPSRRNS